MSESEREFLTKVLKNTKGHANRWIEGGKDAFTVWIILMFLFIMGLNVITWAASAILHIKIGWQSPHVLWIVALAALSIATYAVLTSVRRVKSWHDIRPDIRADLETSEVIEENYTFTAAKRFEELEHGGLFYFLRTTDDRVFVIFDEESQNLGVEGENPLNSKFHPSTELLINRAPKTNWVISKKFSGARLDAGEPQVLTISPEAWPESESFCKFRWDDLEQRLSKKRKRK